MLTRRCYLLPLLLLLCTTAGKAQLSGQLTTPDGKGIPYASLYLPCGQTGTLSEVDGTFTLTTDASADTCTVTFSCLNYESRSLTVAEVRRLAGAERPIVLQPVAIDLTTVAVNDRAINLKPRVWGVPNPKGFSRMGYNFNERGGELGLVIKNEDYCRVDGVELFVSHVELDSFLVEFKLYELVDGKVGEQLQRERIIRTVRRADANRQVAYSLQGLLPVVREPFVLTVTMLGNNVGSVVMLEAVTKKKYQGYRRTPSGRWKKVYMKPVLRAVMRCGKEEE